MNSNTSHYYKILGVPEGSSTKVVKAAYRKLVKQYHPDVNPHPAAAEKFKRIAEAYEMITNPPRINPRQKAEEVRREWERKQAAAKEAARRAAHLRYREYLRQKELEESESFSVGLSAFVIILISIFLLFKAYGWWTNFQIDKHLTIVEGNVEEISNHTVYVSYYYEGRIYEVSKWVNEVWGTAVTPEGMPIMLIDKFQVEIDATNPERARINFKRVDLPTLTRYLTKTESRGFAAFAEELNQLPEGVNKKAVVHCMLNRILEREGVGGLANVYHHKEWMIESFFHNNLTFWWMKKSEGFSADAKACGLPLQ